MTQTKRTNVYKLISKEREYQSRLIKNGTFSPGKKAVGEELTLIHEYAHRAIEAWTDTCGDALALKRIVQVAALCVRCLENHAGTLKLRNGTA